MATQEAPNPPLAYQLDVAVLDNYLNSLLLTKFLSSLDPLLRQDEHNVRRTLRMVASSLLPAMALWFTQAQTPATKALGLRTIMTSSGSSTQTALWKHIGLAALLPLLLHILQGLVMKLQEQQRQEDDEIIDNEQDTEMRVQQRLARERQLTILTVIAKAIKLGVPLCKLGLLLAMLWKPKGQNYSPRLSMVLAGLGFIASSSVHDSSAIADSMTQSSPPSIYVLYAHRRWMYEETMQTFKIVFAPLLASLQEGRQLVESG